VEEHEIDAECWPFGATPTVVGLQTNPVSVAVTL
jgi:hypothetical protein